MLCDLTVQCNKLDETNAGHVQQTISRLKVSLIELRMRLSDHTQSLHWQKARTKSQSDDYGPSSSDVQKWFSDTVEVTVEQTDVLNVDSQDNQVCLFYCSMNTHRHFMLTDYI